MSRFVGEFLLNRFIWKRNAARGLTHMLIMWGCLLAGAITLPLVFGWVHFETVPGDLNRYRTFAFGIGLFDFRHESLVGHVLFHGLVWSSFLVIAGVLLALHRRFRDLGAASLQSFQEDILPLLMLFAVSITGLLLTVSYTWMKGYGYEILSITHAVTVIFTLLWLPFGKFLHIFQRTAQLAVKFYRDAGRAGHQAHCARCRQPFATVMHVEDLIRVEHDMGYRYSMTGGHADHYQQVCPPCRRKMLALAHGRAAADHDEGVLANGLRTRADARTPVDFRAAPQLSDGQPIQFGRDSGQAREDTLLLQRPAVRHSVESQGQRSRRLRALGRLSGEPGHALPEGRSTISARFAPRPPDEGHLP